MTASLAKPLNSAPATAIPGLRLKDIVKTLPREVFAKDPRQAWATVLINVLLVGLGYWALAIAPWFLLPVLWIYIGTGLTGFFVIGHDCGHRSFANRHWVNDLVGHIMFLPLIYPFHAWRIQHNHHHKHTNKLGEDNAWQPWPEEEYAKAGKPLQIAYRLILGPCWWVGSIAHWANLHFNWSQFKGKQRQQVRFSVLVVLIGAAIGFPALIATTGIWGLVKFWVMPWLVYHFWMSTFTLVHHTSPDIPFNFPEDWNEAQAQLAGTVHCDYPRWVEFLCHDINVHIPHHISTAIPWYNLRRANSMLQENWGEYMYQTKFSWSLMRKITDQCQLYHPVKYYQTFKEFHSKSAKG
ncbi:MAG: fatty acid desaturase [Actinomycetota bacterium]